MTNTTDQRLREIQERVEKAKCSGDWERVRVLSRLDVPFLLEQLAALRLESTCAWCQRGDHLAHGVVGDCEVRTDSYCKCTHKVSRRLLDPTTHLVEVIDGDRDEIGAQE